MILLLQAVIEMILVSLKKLQTRKGLFKAERNTELALV